MKQQRKQINKKKTCGNSSHYDPETNWKLDWSKTEYYKRLFKTNCMSRYINRSLKQQEAQIMQLDLEIVDIYMQDKIQSKIINKLDKETSNLCNQIESLQLEYNKMQNMLNEL